MKKKKGFHSISAVSKILNIHQQTIRAYEREGLINPKRSEGNTRLFSNQDVERLEYIIYYTNKMGVNLAGIEIIIKMEKRIEKLQKQIDSLFDKSKKEMEKEKKIRINEATIAKDRLKNLNKKETSNE